MNDHEVNGVFGALFLAAALAAAVFAGVVAFSPDRAPGRAPTPMPLSEEFESLGSGATPGPGQGGPAPTTDPGGPTNRNERAKGMFKWDR